MSHLMLIRNKIYIQLTSYRNQNKQCLTLKIREVTRRNFHIIMEHSLILLPPMIIKLTMALTISNKDNQISMLIIMTIFLLKLMLQIKTSGFNQQSKLNSINLRGLVGMHHSPIINRMMIQTCQMTCKTTHLHNIMVIHLQASMSIIKFI